MTQPHNDSKLTAEQTKAFEMNIIERLGPHALTSGEMSFHQVAEMFFAAGISYQASIAAEPSADVKSIKAKIGDEVRLQNASVVLCSQSNLCDALYALHLAGEDEKNEDRKIALKNVENAIHQITNHFGVDGIGNFDLLMEYEAIS